MHVNMNIPSEFAGSYLLDAQASESLEPMLVASGVPWLIRKLINRSVPKMILQINELELTITVK
jgi:hypothetical protein